jgi:hypothetical protein
MILVDIAIIVKVKRIRAKKKLKLEQFKKQSKQWKIFHTATENNLEALKVRAGQNLLVDLVENYVEVEHLNCVVGQGIRYVNNERLRKIAYSPFKSKAKNGVIFITKTALCHLVEIHGLDLPPLAIPIHDFIGISGWYQLIRKIVSVSALEIPLPMLILAQGPASIIFSLAAGAFGIIAMAYTKDPGFLIIPTDVILTPVNLIVRRIPDQSDLVSVDLKSVSRSKIAEITSNTDVSLNYNEVVNMQDVTKLPKVQFSDNFEVPPSPKPTSLFRLRGTKNYRNPGKTSNFLEKFGDPEFISDPEQWDIITNNPQDAIRIKDDKFLPKN